MFIQERIRQQANRHAHTCETHLVISQEIRDRMLERLSYIMVSPETILDLGCGEGILTQQLLDQYPNATAYGLDIAEQRLQLGNKQTTPFINADIHQLPFAYRSIDMVISHLCFHWSDNIKQAISELYRILNHQGLCFFSYLGPDSLKELRHAWQAIDKEQHVHPFPDMHDIGDILLKEGFENPVMDREEVVVNYRHPKTLLKDLHLSGSANCLQQQSKHCYTPRQLQALYQHYPYEESKDGMYYPATFEVIYGLAWKPDLTNTGFVDTDGEVGISIDSLVTPRQP